MYVMQQLHLRGLMAMAPPLLALCQRSGKGPLPFSASLLTAPAPRCPQGRSRGHSMQPAGTGPTVALRTCATQSMARHSINNRISLEMHRMPRYARKRPTHLQNARESLHCIRLKDFE